MARSDHADPDKMATKTNKLLTITHVDAWAVRVDFKVINVWSFLSWVTRDLEWKKPYTIVYI